MNPNHPFNVELKRLLQLEHGRYYAMRYAVGHMPSELLSHVGATMLLGAGFGDRWYALGETFDRHIERVSRQHRPVPPGYCPICADPQCQIANLPWCEHCFHPFKVRHP